MNALRKRTALLGEFNRQHRMGKAFIAPQRGDRVKRVRSTFVRTAPKIREYRGSDNVKAQRTGSRAGGVMKPLPRMHVPPEFRPPLFPGVDSRRERATVWVPA